MNKLNSVSHTTSSSSSSTANSSSVTSTSTKTTSSTKNNLYTAGQCTWYVYDKVNGAIGSTWGNANNWANLQKQLDTQLIIMLKQVQFYKPQQEV